MIETTKRIEVYNSNKIKIIYNLILIPSIFPLITIIFLLFNLYYFNFKPTIIEISVVIIVTSTPCLISSIGLSLVNIEKVRFSITDNSIEMYFQNSLEFQIFWNSFDKIKILREKFFPQKKILTFFMRREGYNLNFIGVDNSKSIRLWLYPFSRTNNDAILNALKTFSENLNKQFEVVKEVEKLSSYFSLKLWKQIRQL